MNEGFIKIFRSLLEWERYDDINTKTLFIHLLLKCNYQDKNRRGILIKGGERLTSYESLSKETGLSIKQVRLCLSKLSRTHEVAVKSTTSYSIVKLLNYNKYNSEGTQEGKQRANKGQTEGKQRATNKERKEREEYNTPPKQFDGSSFEMDIVNRFIAYRTEIDFSDSLGRELKKGESELKQKYATVINKLKRLDNYSESEIEDTIAFGLKDSFWIKQLHSLAQLRKDSKFQKIRQKMLDKQGEGGEAKITYVKK